ncbi:hypothetical protein H7171_04090 [Candidatus Saccharibacteria bacterium]|nr:hypothetical protein [Candidatus Saccharibacteria bacterium]
MPRLSNNDYVTRCRFIRKIYHDGSGILSVLPYKHQLVTLSYYWSGEDWTVEQMLENRSQLDAKHPSLSARAGKHFGVVQAEVMTRLASEQASSSPTTPSVTDVTPLRARRRRRGEPAVLRTRHISVRGVARRQPDIQKLAIAFLQLAEMQSAREQAEREAQGHDEAA